MRGVPVRAGARSVHCSQLQSQKLMRSRLGVVLMEQTKQVNCFSNHREQSNIQHFKGIEK